jgi:hypothetical protein
MGAIPADLVAAYASLFVQCRKQYAVQQRDGSYWRVAEPLSLSHLSAHLVGRWTLGTYLLDRHSHCAFAVFDADGWMGWRAWQNLRGSCFEKGCQRCSRRVGAVGICGCIWSRRLLRRWCGGGSYRMRRLLGWSCIPNKTGWHLVGRGRWCGYRWECIGRVADGNPF